MEDRWHNGGCREYVQKQLKYVLSITFNTENMNSPFCCDKVLTIYSIDGKNALLKWSTM